MSPRDMPIIQTYQTTCSTQMKSRQKPYCVAAGLLFIALVLVLWPSDSQPVAPTTLVASTRSANRPARPTAASSSRPFRAFSDLVEIVQKGDAPKLTREQIDVYLREGHRSAGSLLAAYRLSSDESFLREAEEKFPDNPQVLLASLPHAEDPTKQLEILTKLRRVDPANGLGDCLSARTLFELGKNDEAMTVMSGFSGKPIQDYTSISCQNVEEAYLSAGFSPLQAKMTSLYESSKPSIIQLRDLKKKLESQRRNDAPAGSDPALQSSRGLQLEMARQVTGGGFIVDSLVAMYLESGVLEEIDNPEARTRLDAMKQEREGLIGNAKRIHALMRNDGVAESDWLLFFDRAKLFGEKAANEWMLKKYSEL
jgi:hypothetical protein